MKQIRTLKANEIDVMVKEVKDDMVSLLLYKNARVDARILDETFDGLWNNEYSMLGDTLVCTISFYDKDAGLWFKRQDAGAREDNSNNPFIIKGWYSDAFKRACTKVGIGSELYSAPKMKIAVSDCQNVFNNKCFDSFSVTEIDYDDQRSITHLVIKNNGSGYLLKWDRGQDGDTTVTQPSDTSAKAQTKPQETPKAKAQAQPQNAPAAEPELPELLPFPVADAELEDINRLITDEERENLYAVAKERFGEQWNRRLGGVCKKFGYDNTKTMKMVDYRKIVETIKEMAV